MKTDKNYKMAKLTKIMLINIHDTHHRGVVGKLFQEAESHSATSRKKMTIKVVDAGDD